MIGAFAATLDHEEQGYTQKTGESEHTESFEDLTHKPWAVSQEKNK